MSEGSNNNATDVLRSVCSRLEQHNNRSTQSSTWICAFSMTQLQSAEQAVQIFVDKMRQTAEMTDEQTKAALKRVLMNSVENSRYESPHVARQQNQSHEAEEETKRLNEVGSWYSFGEEIGRGTFGRVRLATHRLSGTPVAIKSYARFHGARSCLAVDAIGKRVKNVSSGDALEWRCVRQEVTVLSKLQVHPNIVRFVEVFETPTRIHVVTELVRGTSLCDVLRLAPGQRLAEHRAKAIFRQLAGAVEALHAQRIIHRDLKLENVVVDEESGHATIIDFGFSGFEETSGAEALDVTDYKEPARKLTKKKNFCGTPSYMAPEVVTSERYDGRPVDVWSLGVLLYVMLCGKFPFQGTTFHQLYQNLRNGAHQLVLPRVVSVEVRALLQSVLVVDPAKRPSISELCCCSWLQNVERPQASLLLQTQELGMSFETWLGARQSICTALTEFYGVQLNLSMLNQTKALPWRRSHLSAFLELAAAVSSRCFQKIVAYLPPAHTEVNQELQGLSECNGLQPRSKNIASPFSRHKLQLENLIELVKASLATS